MKTQPNHLHLHQHEYHNRMRNLTNYRVESTVMAQAMWLSLPAMAAEAPPDLTKGQTTGVDRKATYNLGSTGMRGWIYLKPATHFDGLQGRTTAPSRQILVTHVGVKSPADGVMQVDDVILGVGGTLFTDDARRSLALAIQEAEKETNQGVLKLTRWRAGKTDIARLKLNVMGTYSVTAPYDCSKSQKIFNDACKVLEKEPLQENWCGAINGLALLATGNPDYDGGEQYGPGRTDDDTYYGNSSYSGLSPTATYVLTYSLALKMLCITGKNANPATMLTKQDVADAVASGRFDLDRLQMTPKQLVAAFSDWSPVARGWAAEELAKRPEAKSMEPELLRMAEGKDVHVAQGACETLGYMKSVEALPVFVRLLSHQDRWLRYKAAQAIKLVNDLARPVLPEILLATAKTAEPRQPIHWADPIQIA